MNNSRRDFIKNSMAASAAVVAGGVLPGFTAKSYASIIGANDRIKVGIMGVNARGLALAKNFSAQPNCEIVAISDVDNRAMQKCVDEVEKIQHSRPQAIGDFRKALEMKSMDAMVIATPDHWHAPASILACKAGKHVYVEKPCSHTPEEGELLVAAAKKYNKQVQMGAQRRSWPNVIEAMTSLNNGLIGHVYFAKGWYANNRPSIGVGKKAAVPEWLDFDLWQGPAPRTDYRDNVLHYNWHWFWNWGTGEAGNNATHFTDLMRWGLRVDYPVSVRSVGGRYRYKDDWETPDTQVITWEFPNNTIMEWEGRSCNGRNVEGSSVGAAFYGEKGTLVLEGFNSYKVYDLNNKLIRDVRNTSVVAEGSLLSPSQGLDALHIQNFFDGIRKDTPLNTGILRGHKSTLLIHLGNIAARMGNISIKTNPENGHIVDNEAAARLWTKDYQPGWKPTV